jgi:SAM-dependent methyltransferase
MFEMQCNRRQSHLMTEQSSSHPSDGFKYSAQDADAYGSLGIAGTTYEVGFDALAEMLGDLTGTTWLDFGAGAGRSSLFLRNLGAAFVFGVDHNFSMVRRAKLQRCPGVAYAVIGKTIPVANESMDGAISCNVYIEIPSRRDMETASTEIYRVLKPGSWFFMMTANPLAIDHEFKSFARAGSMRNLSSGLRAPCVINTPEGVVQVEDFYWTQDDYENVLQSAGFAVREALTPISSPGSFVGTHESIIGPFLIFACFKE